MLINSAVKRNKPVRFTPRIAEARSLAVQVESNLSSQQSLRSRLRITLKKNHLSGGRSQSVHEEIETMSSVVIKKFFIASVFMWAAPIAILYAFNHNLLPGTSQMSDRTVTLLSGFLAVISVNIVIAFYICMALKEPSDKYEPDPKFVADAKASVDKLTGEANVSSSQSSKKQE